MRGAGPLANGVSARRILNDTPRRMRRLKLLSWAAFFAASAEVRALADETDEVVVRGSDSGGFTSRAKLEGSPREVTDAASLVEPLPGVHVRRLGADDSFSTLSIRGSNSNEVAVMLAGVPLTGAADPSLDLSTLPLWPGARARVYRSFAPAMLGPGSLGGTLVLDPPKPGDPEESEVWAAAGAFGSRRIRVGDVRKLDDRGARLATALSASRSDDDFSYYDLDHQDFQTRENAGHADVNGLAAVALPLRWEDGSDGSLTVTTVAQARHQELPGTILRPTRFAKLDSNRELASVELARRAGTGAWLVRAWGRRDDLRLLDRPSGLTLGPTHANDAIVAGGGALGWRGKLARDVHLDAQADASGERFAPGLEVGAAQPPGATRAAAGLGADLTWAPSPLELAATGRVDAWSDHAEDGTGGTEVRPTGHVGGELALGPATVAAHAGALARPPSFVERYGNRGGFLGDPNLRSESALSADVGARVGSRGRVGRASAELVGFGTWANDLIVFVAQGAYGQLRATNIGQARLFGLEAELLAEALGFSLRGAYTALLTFNDAECAGAPSCEPPPLPGRPAHDLVADLSYTLGPATVRYGVDALGGMRADPAGNDLVPARVLFSTGARLDVPGVPGLRVAFDVRNLFDLRIATYAGAAGPVQAPIGDLYQYPLPGRSLLVTMRWTQER